MSSIVYPSIAQVQRDCSPQPPDAVFGPGSRPDVAATGDVCLALDYLEVNTGS